MSPARTSFPADFVPVTIVLPGTSRLGILGYMGEARFVGFYWDNAVGGAVWDDGRQPGLGRGENFTFSRFVRPLGFLYNVNFGTRGGAATHVLVWDREKDSAYMAPRESAIRFLREQDSVNQLPSPTELAGPMQ